MTGNLEELARWLYIRRTPNFGDTTEEMRRKIETHEAEIWDDFIATAKPPPKGELDWAIAGSTHQAWFTKQEYLTHARNCMDFMGFPTTQLCDEVPF